MYNVFSVDEGDVYDWLEKKTSNTWKSMWVYFQKLKNQ